MSSSCTSSRFDYGSDALPLPNLRGELYQPSPSDLSHSHVPAVLQCAELQIGDTDGVQEPMSGDALIDDLDVTDQSGTGVSSITSEESYSQQGDHDRTASQIQDNTLVTGGHSNIDYVNVNGVLNIPARLQHQTQSASSKGSDSWSYRDAPAPAPQPQRQQPMIPQYSNIPQGNISIPRQTMHQAAPQIPQMHVAQPPQPATLHFKSGFQFGAQPIIPQRAQPDMASMNHAAQASVPRFNLLKQPDLSNGGYAAAAAPAFQGVNGNLHVPKIDFSAIGMPGQPKLSDVGALGGGGQAVLQPPPVGLQMPVLGQKTQIKHSVTNANNSKVILGRGNSSSNVSVSHPTASLNNGDNSHSQIMSQVQSQTASLNQGGVQPSTRQQLEQLGMTIVPPQMKTMPKNPVPTRPVMQELSQAERDEVRDGARSKLKALSVHIKAHLDDLE